MNKSTKIILAIIVIGIIAFAGYMIGSKMSDNTKTVDNKQINKVINNVVNEIKSSVKNEVKNSVSENAVTDNEVKNETENEVANDVKEVSTTSTELSDSEKAINMAKEEWGEDDSVTFKVDEQNEKGQFVIKVVDKNTTNVVLEYFIDVNKKTIEQK